MKSQRAHVLLPEDLVSRRNRCLGRSSRVQFLSRKNSAPGSSPQKLLHFLETKDPAWKSQDHPELAGDATAWVHKLRSQSEARGALRHKPKKRAGSQGPTRRTH
jgi:hypothetical protein